MKYVMDKAVFVKLLIDRGYSNVLDFSRKVHIHRNTINNYLVGKNVFVSGFVGLAEQLKASPLELIKPVSEKTELKHFDELKPAISKIKESDDKIAIVLFGSRAKGKEKTYSDWDLGITRGPEKLGAQQYLRLKQVVDDATEDAPRTVDLVNLDQAPRWFLEGIDYQPIFLDGNEENFLYLKGVLDGISKK